MFGGDERGSRSQHLKLLSVVVFMCVCVQAALTLSCLCAPVPLYCLEVDNTQTRARVCAGWSVWSPFLQTMQQAHPVAMKDNQMVHNGPHTDDASYRLS